MTHARENATISYIRDAAAIPTDSSPRNSASDNAENSETWAVKRVATTSIPEYNIRFSDVCRHTLDPGSCNEAYRKVYFNETRRQCMEYMYGGCGGGANRFSTLRECESLCLTRQELPFEDETGPEEGIALEFFKDYFE
jgi:hypothetical protein